ncbi:MAG TPA: SdiA-regulated domain-containing protein [Flavobacteriales bacterium]|nr:SdiA-regulated domain-containing protein [Flavobacteriales bacterium]
MNMVRVILASVLLGTVLNGQAQIPFDLAKPARTYRLPPELLEVSALTDVDDLTLACLHDEAAMLYLFDLRQGVIARRFSFGHPGDMEGLTRVGDQYFALRSDGLVYRLSLKGDAVQVLDTFRLALSNRNIEGLGYDERFDRVLVSPKDIPKGSPELRDVRVIHAFDARTGKVLPEPVLTLSINTLIDQARAKGLTVPMRTTDNGREVPALKLRFSSVAVDPRSDLIYLLSAVDRMVLVVDRQGDLVYLEQLDARAHPKPEGITFLPAGDLLISNEGKGTAPSIVRFSRTSK